MEFVLGMPLVFIAFFGALLAVLIVGARAAKRKEAQRLAQIHALCARRAWTFEPSRWPVHKSFPQFGLFSTGDNRQGTNTIRGTFEAHGARLGLIIGDYSYQTTSTDSKGNRSTTTHHAGYAIATLPPRWVTPSLDVRPENFLDRIGAALGFDDIDFESAEFSRAFHVKSPERRFAYDVLHPRMMEFLLRGSRPRLTLSDGAVLLGATHRASPAQIEGTADWLAAFFELWPAYLVQAITQRADARAPGTR